MYIAKLIDTVLQGTLFLIGLILLVVYDLSGYFYWISVVIIIWDIISIIVNLIYFKPLKTMRLIVSGLIGLILIIFIASFIGGQTIAQLNFYFNSISTILIIIYFALTLSEISETKKGGLIDIDF
ncbi:MAG: hypothetical protein WC994_01005 [Brumimicrobium sp.]